MPRAARLMPKVRPMPIEPKRPRLPGLRRGLPLIFLGLVLLAGGLYLHALRPSAGVGAFPLWLYCIPIGVVALIGGLGSSFFPESPAALRTGAPVADGFVAVPASDWVAIQRLLKPSAASSGAGAEGSSGGISAASAAGSPAPTTGVPSKDLIATSFAFAPALAADTPSSRRKRAGMTHREEPGSVEPTEGVGAPSTPSSP